VVGAEVAPERAHDIAESILSTVLPRRWRHCCGVGDQAEGLAAILGPDAHLVHSAGFVHDIGYAPDLVQTGFHAIDGARYLRDVVGADERLVRLVAHHSCAAIEAEERGLVAEMAEFHIEDPLLTDALIFCDMTTTPDGSRTTADDRIAEVLDRYGLDSIVGRFMTRAAPALKAATARTMERSATGADEGSP
jgi:hypothetical protein